MLSLAAMRAAAAVLIALFWLDPSAVAQSGPGPVHERLKALVGVWHFEGQLTAMPALGANDSGRVVYRHVNEMTNGGFFLETRRTGTGPSGAVTELFVYGWDAAAKEYRQDAYDNRGRMRRFTGTVDGHVWTFRGTNLSASGQTTQERFMLTYAPDMMSATVRSEHSSNGADWFERLTGTYTKVSSVVPGPQ